MKKILAIILSMVMTFSVMCMPTAVTAKETSPKIVTAVVKSQKTVAKKKSKTVYITPTGKKYHYSKKCAGKRAIKTTLKKAKKHYKPCKKCAHG